MGAHQNDKLYAPALIGQHAAEWLDDGACGLVSAENQQADQGYGHQKIHRGRQTFLGTRWEVTVAAGVWGKTHGRAAHDGETVPVTVDKPETRQGSVVLVWGEAITAGTCCAESNDSPRPPHGRPEPSNWHRRWPTPDRSGAALVRERRRRANCRPQDQTATLAS